MQPNEMIDDMITNLTDWRDPVIANIRKLIHEADPDVMEEWKWMGSPVWSHDGIICLANPFKDKVKVTFSQGAHLADPDKIFNNDLEGKQWRSIDIRKGDQLNESAFKALFISGMAYNRARAKPAGKPRAARRDVQVKPG